MPSRRFPPVLVLVVVTALAGILVAEPAAAGTLRRLARRPDPA